MQRPVAHTGVDLLSDYSRDAYLLFVARRRLFIAGRWSIVGLPPKLRIGRRSPPCGQRINPSDIHFTVIFGKRRRPVQP